MNISQGIDEFTLPDRKSGIEQVRLPHLWLLSRRAARHVVTGH